MKFFLDRHSFDGFEPKSYAYFEDSFGMGIKPIDLDAKTLIRLHSTAKAFKFAFGPVAARSEPGDSKEEFLVRCAVKGVTPEFEIVLRPDEWGNESDIVVIETGQSLNALRAEACLKKTKKAVHAS